MSLEPSPSCWHCAGTVSPRALFCHGCGSIQPPGEVDPFTRLGLAAAFDLEQAAIERQLAGFARILAPTRFQAKGEKAQELAQAHRAAQEKAAILLRDPASRARALLELAEMAPARPANGGNWEVAIAAAPEAASRARAVKKIRDEMLGELRLLLDAFRLGDLNLAATRLTRVEMMAKAVEAAR